MQSPPTPFRRLIFVWMGALAVGSLLSACDDSDETSPDATVDAGSDAATRTVEPMPEIPNRVSEAEAGAGRAGCRFGRGAMPWETVGEEFPLGDDIPIDTFVFVMQENRSFDHYFGMMPGVDGLPLDAMNLDTDGNPVTPFHTDDYCIEDVAHNWTNTHLQFAGGAMDGFVTTNDPDGGRAMGYLTEADLPYYYDLYSTFAMSDQHFSSLLGSTWINRFYFMSGTSFGLTSNEPAPEFEFPMDEDYVVMQQLDRRGIDWRVYKSDIPFVLGGYGLYSSFNLTRILPIEDFYAAAEAGELPPVSFVDPSFFQGVTQSDEHPPANPQAGQAFVRDVVNALMQSPQWSRMALVISYDEHGGFYDHVAPPAACDPNDREPVLEGRFEADFDQMGIRVPLVVVSPYAKANYVSDRDTEHASLLRLIQARYLLPAFTGRDANAWPLLDMFDFENPPFMTPPALTDAPVNAERMQECIDEFGDSPGI